MSEFQSRFVSGSYNVICDRCGFQYKAEALFEEPRTGLMVCKKCLDIRNPQEFVRAREEHVTPPWVRLDDVVTYSITNGYLITGNFDITKATLEANNYTIVVSASPGITVGIGLPPVGTLVVPKITFIRPLPTTTAVITLYLQDITNTFAGSTTIAGDSFTDVFVKPGGYEVRS